MCSGRGGSEPRFILAVFSGETTVTSKRGCRGRVGGHPEAVEQAPVGGAAAQEHVLAGVDDQAVAAERHRRAAEPRLGLEQRDLDAPPGRGRSRR
jgi:hypothetical protein